MSEGQRGQIASYCHIKNNRVYRDGKLLFETDPEIGLKEFLTKTFRQYNVRYPKFFKMDEISKLGFLATEILLMDQSEQLTGEDVAVILSNSQSTLVTDTAFQESISQDDHFFPSPSVFVYTLPNIMVGEISIRHKCRGENAFFIFDRFNEEFLTDYINLLYSNNKLKVCIGGWVDQSADDYEAFLYLTTQGNTTDLMPGHNAGEVRKLYKSI